ncbi:MAG: aminotransferase class IV [Staphylococcus epidermidis]|nr:aminotransferase class IV [Staphylococcus epidermidis]
MHLFETMKLDRGFIPRLEYHYQRISTSSEHLGFQFDHLLWKQFIHNIKTLHSKGVYRLKVTLNKEGELNYELFPIPDKPFFTARLVQQKKNIDKVIITNKTTERDYLTHNQVIEKDFYIEEFKEKIKSSQINVYLINSLREVVGVKVYV